MSKSFLASGILAGVLSVCLAPLVLIGCVSVPQPAPVSMPDKKDMPFTAAQYGLQEKTAPTAKLVLSRGGGADVSLLKVEGVNLPKPADGKYWSPVDVPAGQEMAMVVRFTAYGDILEVAFICPPLTAGKTYMLTIDAPFFKNGKMRVVNRRYFTNRGWGVILSTLFWEMLLVGMPDAIVELCQPMTIKTDAPREGASLLLYERTDNGRSKNKISLWLIYQYSLYEAQGYEIL